MVIESSSPPAVLVAGCLVGGSTEPSFVAPLKTLVGASAAERIVSRVSANGLANFSATELASMCGVSLKVAERIVAARTMTDLVTRAARPPATTSNAVAEHLPLWLRRAETEFLIALALGSQLDIRATVLVAKGGASETAFTPRDVFAPLLRLGATAFVLAHNHPGGCSMPSREDVAITNSLARFGRALGIRLVDHLIVTATHVRSFHDTGLMPTKQELDLMDTEGPVRVRREA